MAVTHEQKLDPERGIYYEITLSASGDVAQAALIPGDLKGKLDWLNGKVSWHKGASVNTTFTNAGPDAMVVGSTGNGVLLGWAAHPDNSMTQASETLPITGLRFTASAASQKIILYTGRELAAGIVDAGTPA